MPDSADKTAKATKRSRGSAPDGAEGRFSAAEKAAMQERARELKAEARRAKKAQASEADLLAKVAEMDEPDRAIAERLHAIVKENAPSLTPKTWYGMPAYADASGKVVCFFQAAGKFDTRYASFGFNDSANLDAGAMWPTAFAITAMTPEVERELAALVKRAVG
ncbi:MAG: DUF1801 domain-containing protein [Deinococcales bacterium]|nr:DUF1801 domain-containing protein [Deinococcales bacterium]